MSEARDQFMTIGMRPLAPTLAASRRTSASAEQRWTRRYRARLMVSDSAIVGVSVLAAFALRFTFGPAEFGGLGQLYLPITASIVIAWMIMLAAFRTRDPRVIGAGMTEYRRVAGASVVAFGVMAILFMIAKLDVARGFFVLTLPIGLVALTGSRWLWRRWLVRQRVRGHYLSRALVVGSAFDAAYVVRQIREKSGVLFNIVGAAVDTDNEGRSRLESLGVTVLASTSTIASAAANLNVDTVIVAGQPNDGGTFIRDLSWQLEGTATDLVLASRLTDVAGPRIHFRPVEGLPLLHVEIPQFEGGKHVLKRALDVVVSGIALLLLSPVFLIVGLLVRRDSEGPAFFSQERVGRNNRVFVMRKFRSMVTTAEADRIALEAANEGSGLLFKMKDDPRVTRVGRIIRKFSIDELPQLWNVFVGDMSMVGPRPPLPSEVAAYESSVHRRLYIKPGLTGMWQVSGRSDLSWDESVRLDLYYVENWSVLGDLIIMWRTVRVLLKPVGAY